MIKHNAPEEVVTSNVAAAYPTAIQTQYLNLSAEVLPIVIRGLPGVGKTTLSNLLRKVPGTFQINADLIRTSKISSDLGFTFEDRTKQAARMGALTKIAAMNGYTPITDFIMATKHQYDSFCEGLGHNKSLLVDLTRSIKCRFPDTEKIYESGSTFGHSDLFHVIGDGVNDPMDFVFAVWSCHKDCRTFKEDLNAG